MTRFVKQLENALYRAQTTTKASVKQHTTDRRGKKNESCSKWSGFAPTFKGFFPGPCTVPPPGLVQIGVVPFV